MATKPSTRKPKDKPKAYGVFAASYAAAMMGESPEQALDMLLRQYGSSTTWVYISVNRIANACAQIPLQYIKKNRKGKPGAVIEGPVAGLRDLLSEPNPFQSYFDFVEEGQIALDLTGNAYIELAKLDKLNRPHELYWLNPSKMTVIPDEQQIVKGYIYNVNGKEIKYPANEIIHIKYAHPANDYYGFSPMTAAKYAIETDKDSSEWNRNFLRKGAWPAGAIETDNNMDEETEARVRAEIKRVAQGGKEAVGRLLLLVGGLKYKAIGVSPKEMDWLDARRMSRDEILAIYGVPFSVAGLYSQESTTSRSAGVAQQVINFYLFTVFPKRMKFLAALNRGLANRYPGNVEIVDDVRNIPALKDDVQKELIRSQAFRTLTTSGWSMEMALAELYPHVPPPAWGNVMWVNQAMVPISGPTNPFAAKPPTDANPTTPSGDVPTDPVANDQTLPTGKALAIARALDFDDNALRAIEDLLHRNNAL